MDDKSFFKNLSYTDHILLLYSNLLARMYLYNIENYLEHFAVDVSNYMEFRKSIKTKLIYSLELLSGRYEGDPNLGENNICIGDDMKTFIRKIIQAALSNSSLSGGLKFSVDLDDVDRILELYTIIANGGKSEIQKFLNYINLLADGDVNVNEKALCDNRGLPPLRENGAYYCYMVVDTQSEKVATSTNYVVKVDIKSIIPEMLYSPGIEFYVSCNNPVFELLTTKAVFNTDPKKAHFESENRNACGFGRKFTPINKQEPEIYPEYLTRFNLDVYLLHYKTS